MKGVLGINPAIGPYYDKLLHASLTFLLLLFLHKWLSIQLSVLVVVFLQIDKSLLNFYCACVGDKKDEDFWRDWMANLAGWVLVILYLLI